MIEEKKKDCRDSASRRELYYFFKTGTRAALRDAAWGGEPSAPLGGSGVQVLHWKLHGVFVCFMLPLSQQRQSDVEERQSKDVKGDTCQEFMASAYDNFVV